MGNYVDAISCYNEVLCIDPLAADGLLKRGNTFKEVGRVSEAFQDYIRPVIIRPTMAEAHANLALAYQDSGHVEAGIKSYKQALLLPPNFIEETCNLLNTLQALEPIGRVKFDRVTHTEIKKVQDSVMGPSPTD